MEPFEFPSPNRRCHRYRYLIDPDEILQPTFAPTQRRFKVFGRRLHPVLKKLRKVTRKYRNYIPPNTRIDNAEHITLACRTVLRNEGPIDVDEIVSLHSSYQRHEKFANQLLEATRESDYPEDLLGTIKEARQRCTIRTIFEESLKSRSQLWGLVAPDRHTSSQSQELFEQFFQVHGNPNEAEKSMLGMVGGINVDHVDEWFKTTRERLRILKPMLVWNWAKEVERAAEHRRTRKPLTRH